MRYISNEVAPKRWSDYVCNPIEKELAKNYIVKGAGNKEGLPRAIYITGPSGCGKTTYAKLLMRSFRCINRKDDEYEPCGECAYCLADNDERLQGLSEGDCAWVQPGMRSETIPSQLKIALERARHGPTISAKPHRNVLWVVFDEWPYAKNLSVDVLAALETLPDYSNVCFLFLSMFTDNSDSQLTVAHDRRCSLVKLRPSTTSAIHTYLCEKFPELPESSLRLVAEKSKGSIGIALARLDDILQRDPECSEEMTSYQLELCLPKHRHYIWNLLLGPRKKGYIIELKQILEDILTFANGSNFSEQLLEDILLNIEQQSLTSEGPSPEHLLAIDKLQQYRLFPERSSLLSTLIHIGNIGRELESTKGIKLVDYDKSWSDEGELEYAILK